jgi:hypothetical protein
VSTGDNPPTSNDAYRDYCERNGGEQDRVKYAWAVRELWYNYGIMGPSQKVIGRYLHWKYPKKDVASGNRIAISAKRAGLITYCGYCFNPGEDQNFWHLSRCDPDSEDFFMPSGITPARRMYENMDYYDIHANTPHGRWLFRRWLEHQCAHGKTELMKDRHGRLFTNELEAYIAYEQNQRREGFITRAERVVDEYAEHLRHLRSIGADLSQVSPWTLCGTCEGLGRVGGNPIPPDDNDDDNGDDDGDDDDGNTPVPNTPSPLPTLGQRIIDMRNGPNSQS